MTYCVKIAPSAYPSVGEFPSHTLCQSKPLGSCGSHLRSAVRPADLREAGTLTAAAVLKAQCLPDHPFPS